MHRFVIEVVTGSRGLSPGHARVAHYTVSGFLWGRGKVGKGTHSLNYRRNVTTLSFMCCVAALSDCCCSLIVHKVEYFVVQACRTV